MAKCATCGGSMPCSKHSGAKADMIKNVTNKFMKMKGKKK